MPASMCRLQCTTILLVWDNFLTESAWGPEWRLPQGTNDTGEGAEQARIATSDYKGWTCAGAGCTQEVS